MMAIKESRIQFGEAKSGGKEREYATSSLRSRLSVSCFVQHSTISSKPLSNFSTQRSQTCPIVSCRQDSDSQPQHPKLSRRTVLSLVMASLVATDISKAQAGQSDTIKEPSYDAIKTRRYVGIGRFTPDRPAPQFDAKKKLFQVGAGLEAQDVQVGQGDASVRPGSLVVARWIMVLEDGSTVEAANEKQPAMFRPGAHQVPPGIEDSVIGMRPGGVRRVKGTSERILTDVKMGYDIGERSLVPNGSKVFIDISVDGIDPFGTR